MTELVVVVCDRGRLRDTVSYALREGRDAGRERPVAVRVLVPVGPGADGLARPAAEVLTEAVLTACTAGEARAEREPFAPGAGAGEASAPETPGEEPPQGGRTENDDGDGLQGTGAD